MAGQPAADRERQRRDCAPSPSTARACSPSSPATGPGPTGWRTSSRHSTRPASGISIGRRDGSTICRGRGRRRGSAEIVAPRLTQVVRVVGRPAPRSHDLRFEGLTFAHTEWQPPADYASSLQAGIEVPGALLFDYAERCAVTGGGIEHIGNYGVEVGVGCADIEIARNRITDIGAGRNPDRPLLLLGDRRLRPTDRAGTPAQGRHAERPAQPADHGGRQRDRPLRAVHPGSGGRVRGRQRRATRSFTTTSTTCSTRASPWARSRTSGPARPRAISSSTTTFTTSARACSAIWPGSTPAARPAAASVTTWSMMSRGGTTAAGGSTRMKAATTC